MPSIELLPAFVDAPPWLETVIGVVALAFAAFLANLIVKQVILRIFQRAVGAAGVKLKGAALDPVVRRLANVVPAIVIARGVAVVPHLPEAAVTVVRNVTSAFIVLTIVMALVAALDLANSLYQRRPTAVNRPIKGYLQVVKILLYAGAAILIAAALMEQSPLLLLSGLGAMAAVLMLVFKDTLLSLVASVQLTSNDMLRVGDWIEMPELNADGEVIDIALHTVKVQNWDKTITAIPTHRLVSDSYKNWRGMFESGGRRIMRPLYIDQTTIRFLNDEERAELHRFALLAPHLDEKQAEIDAWNAGLQETGRDPINARRMTNIGAFRAYVQAYLEGHAKVDQNKTLLVRQLQPTPQGLPLEIFCFAATTAWADYEAIQADIFDHLLAILPEFHLLLFQEPCGRDMRQMLADRAAAPAQPAPGA